MLALIVSPTKHRPLSGIRIERSERGAPGEFAWIENASAEELRAFLADKLGATDISAAAVHPPS